MSELKEWIAAVIGIVVCAGIFIQVILVGVDKNEVVDCLRLKAYSEQFSEFHFPEDRRERCEVVTLGK